MIILGSEVARVVARRLGELRPRLGEIRPRLGEIRPRRLGIGFLPEFFDLRREVFDLLHGVDELRVVGVGVVIICVDGLEAQGEAADQVQKHVGESIGNLAPVRRSVLQPRAARGREANEEQAPRLALDRTRSPASIVELSDRFDADEASEAEVARASLEA